MSRLRMPVKVERNENVSLLRFLAPGCLLMLALAAGAISARATYFIGSPMFIGSVLLYALGSLWWLVAATAPAPRLWPNLLLLWAPALTPVALAILVRTGPGDEEARALLASPLAIVAGASLMICGFAAFMLFERRKAPPG